MKLFISSSFFIILIFSMFLSTFVSATLINRHFPIKKYNGQIIICTPYTVKKDTNIFKLLEMKGEIARHDFHQFLQIFKYINPDIKNIDDLLPGQNILLPLKKLNSDTISKQSKNSFQIPLISIGKIHNFDNDECNRLYTIKQGDTVSKIISKEFGSYGTSLYFKGLRLFKLLNKHINNLDEVYIGEQICLPSIDYKKIKDPKTNIQTNIYMPELEYNFFSLRSSVLNKNRLINFITEISIALDLKLKDNGFYHFPRRNSFDLKIDLSLCPVIELENGFRILIDLYNILLEKDKLAVSELWPISTILNYSQDCEKKFLDILVSQGFKNKRQLLIKDDGFQTAVRGDWIIFNNQKNILDNSYICLSFLKSPENRTSNAVRDYLYTKKIILKEWIEQESLFTRYTSINNKSGNKIILKSENLKYLIKDLITFLDCEYKNDIELKLNYAGFNITTRASLIITNSGEKILVDYGSLYGDAISIIKQKGLKLITLYENKSIFYNLKKLLQTVNIKYIENPVFFGSNRNHQNTTSIVISGILIQAFNKDILIVQNELKTQMVLFLNEKKINVFEIQNNFSDNSNKKLSSL